MKLSTISRLFTLGQRLPSLALGLLLISSGLSGRALGPQDLTTQGWIDPLLAQPGIKMIAFLLGCLGFAWGALAPQRRSPFTQPLLLALGTWGISLGVGVLGGLTYSLLTLSVWGTGWLLSEIMGSTMTGAIWSEIPTQMQGILQFSMEMGLWLGALLWLTSLAGSILMWLHGQSFPYSQAILFTFITLGLGWSWGWGNWIEILLPSFLVLATSVSLPFWTYEQADQHRWGRGPALLLATPIAVVGLGLGWGLYLGFAQVLPGITFALATLLVTAPAVIVFEMAWQRGLRGGPAVALSGAALLIPAMGLGLGLLYHGQGLSWLDRLL